ncbi:iron-sulfur cluster repair di-iron protein [Epilithonimonas ginsengisoli]|jgi:regulator of cell morphogenesis and NO signaling|uniref:Iron-sulfur cluster repair di-iron protein n=1 Tax=Epilithonimonas ginsengisoli TaxID=1245592 RepID=A0ABU4JHP7_9FLAO|nr:MULTISPECIES: iron-sulfur cluster repair di-iron protein [Chryseobacterium group]MBV6880572.1 iron-sulfur cluster repair di-iron protein [Epilithonimonas sp. FP105]MDW8549093.1 iron-sulfur cluster repair di-iron protein [Epilithonimonas ginsengisoli]OAH72838.1 iron-sulfur cluster repair di-iron protein [Chryseobacterium sp. FP211-J200]
MNTQTDFIGDIVAADFRTAAIFKKYGIDFCCKGGRTIEEACSPKSLDKDQIYSDIENLPKTDGNSIDFNSWPLDLLADYVEKTHHRYVEEKTPVLQQFLDKLCKVHGGAHPELFEIRDLFFASAQDLAAHMKKEELILFPFVKNMVKAKISNEAIQQPHFGTVENPVNMMKHEHTVEGERLRKIADLTNEYTPPADACNTYKVTFAMLQDFENDLHKHIHLENNILFPKAIQLEKEFSVEH